VENVVPIPTDRYEVVNGKMELVDYGLKRRSFGETNKW